MSAAHDAPEYAAVRAFADLPVLPGDPALPERETFRARLLARDASTMRDRQRQRLELFLTDTLRATKPGDAVNRHHMVGAVIAAQLMDVISYDEGQAWIDRAWEASRAR